MSGSRTSTLSLAAVVLLSLLAACTNADGDAPEPSSTGNAATTATSEAPLRDRLDVLDSLITTWRAAETIDEAHAAAEAAANLIVGPGGPSCGDRDANGTLEGATDVGLLPALSGSPTGIANPLETNECIVRDVLGGSWDQPAERWNTMLTAIDEWRPNRNTMPSLPSHPMRIVGWATFTLASDSLDEAHEYAGHAQLHVNVSLAALDC